MKELYSIRPGKRRKLILILAVFFFIFLGTEFIEKKYMQQINHDFSSLYEDRLIPASQLYEMSELLHEKQFIFELLEENEFRFTPANIAKVEKENRQFEEILTKYETTYLVEEEEQYLNGFKTDLNAYLKVEKEILFHLENQNYSTAQLLIHSEGRELYNQANAKLHKLAQIQPKIGKELLAHYQSSFGSSSALYYFKVALTLIIGLLILRILGFINLVTTPKQRFEWN